MKLPEPATAEQRLRLDYWEKWLENFQIEYNETADHVEFSFIPQAAWLLNNMYWKLVEQYLRPVLKKSPSPDKIHKLHPYKIISTSEITIMLVEPIEVENDPRSEKVLNALLAWFVATQIIEGWEINDTIKIGLSDIQTISSYREPLGDESNQTYPESFAVEHMKWLQLLNVSLEKPLLINAQCWRMFYLACLALASKGDLK